MQHDPPVHAVHPVHPVRPAGAAPVLVAPRARVFVPALRRRAGARRVLAAGSAVVAGTLVSLLRQPGVSATDTMWAEDGALFLADAASRPLPEAVFTSYNGYFLLAPRLLAEAIAWFPPGWAAPLTAVTAAAVNSLLAVVVYVASAGVLRSPALRAAVAVVAVITPVGAYEVPNSLANLQWAGLYALFWVALWVPAGRGGRAVAALTALAVSTTSFLAIVFVPLVALRLRRRRDRVSALIAAGLGAGVVLQVAGLLLGASRRDGLVIDLGGAFTQFRQRFPPVALGGDHLVGTVTGPLNPVMATMIWCAIGVVVAVGLVRWRSANWPVAGLALLHSLLFWLVTVGVTGGPSTRYTTTAAMLLFSALAALVVPGERAPTARSRFRPSPAVPAAVFAVLVGVACLANLRPVTGRSDGPSWSAGVDQARAACARGGPGMMVDVPVSPAGWHARLPCAFLVR